MRFATTHFPKLKPLQLLAACAALLLLLIGFACNLSTENGHTYINVKKDAAWVEFDSLEIAWKDPATGAGGILFHGDPATLLDVNKLEAQGYQGGKITVTVKGFLNHTPVYEDHRGFDGANPAATTKDIVLGGPIGSVKPTPPRLSPILSEATVSIHDSVSFLANAVLDSGSFKAYAFDYNGDGRYDDSLPITGLSARIQGRFNYHAAATYTVTLKVIAQTDSVAIAQVSVLVSQDEPIADAGQDTTVYPSTLIHLHGRGKDGLGSIVKTEWKVANGPFLPAPQDTTFTAPAILGDIQALYRVTDDDTLSAIDSVLVHVISTTESNLTGIVVSKGTLAPQFNPTVFAYTDTVPFDATSLTVSPAGNGVLTVNGTVVVSGTPSGPVTVGPGTTNVEVTVELAGSPKKTYTVTVVRATAIDTVPSIPTPLSGNANLSALALSTGALDQVFAPGDTVYTASVPTTVTSIALTPTLADTAARLKITPNSPVTLNLGANPIAVVVTAKNGTQKTYALTVTRAAPNLSNADLANLTVSFGSLDTAFRASDTLYQVAVTHDILNFSVFATLADTGARYTVTPASPMSLKVGANPISVVVTAKNGTKKTYAITVTRAGSSNANLIGLTVSPGTFTSAFKSADTIYSVFYANSISNATITATLADTTAKVTLSPGSSVSLKVGISLALAVVTAQDGTKKTYTINFTRSPSDNANLAGLSFSSGELVPTFDSLVNNYTAYLPDTSTTARISATLADTTARLATTPSSPMNLISGVNPVSLVVTAQSGITKTYKVNVIRRLKIIGAAACFYTTLAIREDNTLTLWGSNTAGEGLIPTGLKAKSVACIGQTAAAIQMDGTVQAWGLNDHGQATVPASLTGVTAVSTGESHTVALKSNGTVVIFGADTNHLSDTVPTGLSGVKAISAGGYHTLALTTAGTVVAWGWNAYGQCDVPPGLTGVKAISAGWAYSVALKTDGTVVAWGYNVYGQCDIPAGLTGVQAIAAGSHHVTVLKADGTLAAWGYNNEGQTDIPAGLKNIKDLIKGSHQTIVIRTDGTIVEWGYNDQGQCNIPKGVN